MKRRVDEWKMELAIVQNPHVKEPQTLWNELDQIEGKGVRDEKIDREGMMKLKALLTNSNQIKVK